jgi:hypothetical protein
MTVSKEFVSHVFALAAEQLAQIGFQRRRTDIFTVTVNEEVVGWLGLNKALYHGSILQVNPVVGVRHQKLESRVAELLDQRPHPYIPASISTNVGYLTPEKRYLVWSFQEGVNCESVVFEMIAAIEKFGRPFMQQTSTLAAISTALFNSKRGTPPDQLDYRIAAAADLLGKHAEAEAFVVSKLRELENRSDEAADWFRRFATKIRER